MSVNALKETLSDISQYRGTRDQTISKNWKKVEQIQVKPSDKILLKYITPSDDVICALMQHLLVLALTST